MSLLKFVKKISRYNRKIGVGFRGSDMQSELRLPLGTIGMSGGRDGWMGDGAGGRDGLGPLGWVGNRVGGVMGGMG